MELSLYKTLGLVLVFVSVFPTAAEVDTPDPYQDKIDALLAPYLEGEYIVGVSIGLITPEGRYTYHGGTITAGKDESPTDQTLYEIGSITKTFTGLLLAQGVLKDQWALDDPAFDYLPEAIPLPDGVTLRRLSTHTSGLPRMPGDFKPTDTRNPYVDYDTDALFQTLRQVEMAYEPGESVLYSNLGVGLLGHLMATKQGKTYEQLLQAWALKPLGMDGTAIELDAEKTKRLAGPHNSDGDPAYPWGFDALAGAGGIRSDIVDMLRYAQAQIDPDATPIADAIRMTQARHTAPDGPSLAEGTGLGWLFLEDGAVLVHDGMTGGFASSLTLSAEKQLAVVILSNTANPHTGELARQVWKMVNGADVKPADLPAIAEVDEQVLKPYAGRYMMGFGIVFDISMDRGKLYAQLTGQPRFRLFPTDQDSFRYRVVDAAIDFVSDEAGKVTHLILHQHGREFKCARMEEEEGD